MNNDLLLFFPSAQLKPTYISINYPQTHRKSFCVEFHFKQEICVHGETNDGQGKEEAEHSRSSIGRSRYLQGVQDSQVLPSVLQPQEVPNFPREDRQAFVEHGDGQSPKPQLACEGTWCHQQ